MRLLSLSSSKPRFEIFYGDTPPYAILSHTWGEKEEEVTYQDLRNGTGGHKQGYKKIKECCDRATNEGLEYVWIDTCCIDKTNSVELQEAINSMFSWYKRSAICYVYLSDYDGRPRYSGYPRRSYSDGRALLDVELFKASKWFTRGWTLQELIASPKSVFYSQDWGDIGDKTDLGDLISSITRISPEVLAGQDLELSSVAQRMSWASTRKTTRPEDIAYCLLGIFGVNMPLIYGEGGQRAFLRLQKAIMEQSDDHSLFAWMQLQGPFGHGLLASSPALFTESTSLIRKNHEGSGASYSMTNRGLHIQLCLTSTLQGGDHVALLGCGDSKDSSTIGIYVAFLDDGRCVRTRLDQLARIQSLHHENYKLPALSSIYIPQVYLSEKPTKPEYHFRVMETPLNCETDRSLVTRASTFSLRAPSFFRKFRPIRLHKTTPGGFTLSTSTSPGRTTNNGTPEFTLLVGGMAGVLFIPSKAPIPSIPPSSKLQFVAVVFGINLDGSVYGDIVEIMEEDCKQTMKDMCGGTESGRRQTDEIEPREWFERHLLNSMVRSSGWKHKKDISELTFSMEIEPKIIDGKMVFQVSTSYARRA
ncbi:heterokaryon incompatibility protein-domain-containing protein [Leptodontidium sp. 2 PMI_412]|nr:heterokaryon incompatibility protein-domain-containing protein [Leptodontidium sp. 2 PMI_412]